MFTPNITAIKINLKNRLFIQVLAFVGIALTSCTLPKEIQAIDDTKQSASFCDRPVKYTIEKVKMIEGGNEMKVHAEITIDPLLKNINLYADDPEKGKKTFDTQIESIECTLNENLTSGQATYKGYIKQNDGTKTWTSLTIEFKDNQLIVNGTNEDRPSNIYMIIDRWEFVTN